MTILSSAVHSPVKVGSSYRIRRENKEQLKGEAMANLVSKSSPNWPSLGGRRFLLGLVLIFGIAAALLLLIRYTLL